MKLSSHGYTRIEVKDYEMSVGEMVGTICQTCIKAGHPEWEIRLVDVFEGEVSKWCGVVGIMTHEWNMDWRVHVYQMCVMTDCNGNDYFKVIFDSDGEDD